MAEVMENVSAPRILIVGDDAQHGTFLEHTLPAGQRATTYWAPPLRAVKALQHAPYHLILLDMFVPQARCLDLVTVFRMRCPMSKIILMADSADQPAGIKALQMGVYDVLAKPLSPNLLEYAVKRALAAQQVECHSQEALAELTQTQQELRDCQTHLTALTQELLNTHKALAALACHTEKVRQETEEHLMSQMKLFLLPILQHMSTDKEKEQRIQLNNLLQYMEHIQEFPATFSAISSLSLREWKIACLIKQGMSNEEISAKLYIAPTTVKTHRRNIRKKLGLTGTKNKLFAYFQTLEQPSPQK